MSSINELTKEFIKLCLEDNKILSINNIDDRRFIRNRHGQIKIKESSPFQKCVLNLKKASCRDLTIDTTILSEINPNKDIDIYIGHPYELIEFDFNLNIVALKNVKNIFFMNCVFKEKVRISRSSINELSFRNCLFPKEIVFNDTTSKLIDFQNRMLWKNLRVNNYISSHDPLPIDIHENNDKNKIQFSNCNIEELQWRAGHICNPQVLISGGKILTWNVGNLVSHSQGHWTIQNLSLSKFNFNSGDSKSSLKMQTISGHAPDSTINANGNFENLNIETLTHFQEINLTDITINQNEFLLKNIDAKSIHINNLNYNSNHNEVDGLYLELSKLKNTFDKGIAINVTNMVFEGKILFKDIALSKASFYNVKFNDSLEFINVKFYCYLALWENNFTDKCHIQFSNCKFKTPRPSDDYNSKKAEESFRILKNQSKKINYEYGEHLFTALELKARCDKLKWSNFEKWIGEFGWRINKFGESLLIPFLMWASTIIYFTFFYYGYNLLDVANKTHSNFFEYYIPSALYSLDNALFFTKILSRENFHYPTIAGSLWGAFQFILNAIFLYLFIAGVKKRFRQK